MPSSSKSLFALIFFVNYSLFAPAPTPADCAYRTETSHAQRVTVVESEAKYVKEEIMKDLFDRMMSTMISLMYLSWLIRQYPNSLCLEINTDFSRGLMRLNELGEELQQSLARDPYSITYEQYVDFHTQCSQVTDDTIVLYFHDVEMPFPKEALCECSKSAMCSNNYKEILGKGRTESLAKKIDFSFLLKEDPELETKWYYPLAKKLLGL